MRSNVINHNKTAINGIYILNLLFNGTQQIIKIVIKVKQRLCSQITFTMGLSFKLILFYLFKNYRL